MQQGNLSNMSRMVLYPADPGYAPATMTGLVEQLQQRGLVGERWRDDRYLVGHRFMQEIIFVGCSPFLRVDPADDLEFCHLQIAEPEVTPVFRYATDAGPPRCPECRQPVSAADDEEDENEQFYCSECQCKFQPRECVWRAGKTCDSRILISIWTLQKGDAQASESLLIFLHEITNVDWKVAFL